MNSEEFSCIKQVVRTVQLSLPLMFISNEFAGITGVLDSWRRQYVKQLEAIVVNYKNVSLTSRYGAVSTQRSYAVYNVKATFELFCPNIGDIVKGKINRVSREHIGCLIQETINVNIHLPRNSPGALSKYIYLEREILFEISHFSCEPRVIRVTGNITPKCIELMDSLFPVVEEEEDGYEENDTSDREVNLSILNSVKSPEKKSKKRKRERESSVSESVEESPREEAVRVGVKTPKKKKIRSLDEHTDSPKKAKLMNNLDEVLPEKTPKKKKKLYNPDGDLTTSMDKTPKKAKLINNLDEDSTTSTEKTPKKKKKLYNPDEATEKTSTDDSSEKTPKKAKLINNLDEDSTTSTEKTPKKKKKLYNTDEDLTTSTDKTPKKKKVKGLKTDSPKKTKMINNIDEGLTTPSKKKKSKSYLNEHLATSPEMTPKKNKSKTNLDGDLTMSLEKTPKKKKSKTNLDGDLTMSPEKTPKKNKSKKEKESVESDMVIQSLKHEVPDSSEEDAINQALVNSEHLHLMEAIKNEVASLPSPTKSKVSEEKNKKKRKREEEGSTSKKDKKKKKDGAKSKDKKKSSKDKKKSSKKKSKMAASGAVIKKDKKRSKDDKSKSSKSKKNPKKDKSEKKKSKKIKLSSDNIEKIKE